MTIIERLNAQRERKEEEVRNAAEQCLTIYENLRSLGYGYVSQKEWSVLTTVKSRINGTPCQFFLAPSRIGKIFLKGINTK